MRRVTAVAVITMSLTAFASRGLAQDARQRQAAAEAYDRGTTAYLDEAYDEAARWFETANRLAPAAPALMQAIRAHEHKDNVARAATLALELSTSYPDDRAAAEFASGVLTKHAGGLVKVEVICNEDCKLDLDGKLLEFMAFFVTPDTSHHLIATFESGSKSVDLQGAAGEKRVAQFSAPPPPLLAASSGSSLDSENGAGATHAHAPLPPLATWIALGVTAAVGAATIVSGVDARAGVPGYEKAATAYTNCRKTPDADCKDFESKAGTLLKSGQSRELRTNVLIGVTAAAAVGTAVIAIFFTDWSGDREKPATASMRLRLEPRPGGVVSVLEGQF